MRLRTRLERLESRRPARPVVYEVYVLAPSPDGKVVRFEGTTPTATVRHLGDPPLPGYVKLSDLEEQLRRQHNDPEASP